MASDPRARGSRLRPGASGLPVSCPRVSVSRARLSGALRAAASSLRIASSHAEKPLSVNTEVALCIFRKLT